MYGNIEKKLQNKVQQPMQIHTEAIKNHFTDVVYYIKYSFGPTTHCVGLKMYPYC